MENKTIKKIMNFTKYLLMKKCNLIIQTNKYILLNLCILILRKHPYRSEKWYITKKFKVVCLSYEDSVHYFINSIKRSLILYKIKYTTFLDNSILILNYVHLFIKNMLKTYDALDNYCEGRDKFFYFVMPYHL
jgi:hypothetical protein